MRLFSTLCSLCLLIITGASAARISYHSGRIDYFSKVATSDVQLTPAGLTGVTGALLSSQPSSQAVADAHQQVEGVLSGDVFARPAAVLALQVIGGDDALKQTILKAPVSHALALDADASALLQAVGAVAGGQSQNFLYKTLDHVGLPETCDERCQELHVQDMVHSLGYNYTVRKQPSLECSPGPWCSWVTEGEEKLLDMGLLADRLWALELGILRANVLQAAAGHKAVAGVAHQQPKLLEATLVGLQALRAKYGRDSVQATTATKMLHGVVAQVWQALSEVYDGRVVMQLASADLPAGTASGLEELMRWRTQHRQTFQRRMLQQDDNYVTLNIGATSVQWATSSTAWLIFVTILVFLVASSICLCNMSFEQDTLLYTRPKSD